MSFQRVSVLGLGTMGAGMATNLVKAGFSVIGYNRNPSRANALTSSGLRTATDPASAVEAADAVITCVANDRALTQVLLESGALDRMARETLLIECGTTSLGLTERIGEACDQRGLGFLDAPITGSKLGAESGRLTFMVGGPTGLVEKAQPLFDAMGQYTAHVGERRGDGQRIKVCLNLTQAVVLEGVLEGYALAKAQGMSVESLAEVFENSAGKTGVGTFKTPYLLRSDFEPHFRLDLMQKDLHLALEQASHHRVPLTLGRAVASLYDLAATQGWGAEDFLATAKLLGFGESQD